ncbi:DUF3558 domain-containing protein [Nocardia sp. ET3-3]|uniref:DUF3558 domain-containing protein n=1 Tax=Nocardia terrae TaxID=2675851 RepID=A0A7K1V4R0_9NOCA|nr:DUF3558 family protein [Nocardia terrae]MVU81596.1 DUF3558 domain-containing protein [Nocardia terrae]
MTNARTRFRGKLILLLLLLVAAVTSCSKTATGPSEPLSASLSSQPLRLDPCTAVPPDQLSAVGLEVRIPNHYNGPFSEPNLKFAGCLVRYMSNPDVEFYLQATNITSDYLQATLAKSRTFHQVKIGTHDATLATPHGSPGECMLLVSMSDYRLLLDGSFPNKSCDLATDIATKLIGVPQLQ